MIVNIKNCSTACRVNMPIFILFLSMLPGIIWKIKSPHIIFCLRMHHTIAWP